MSPDMWRKMFKSHYIRMFELLKKTKSDLIIIMHSDGAVASILNDFIEIGVDVYNPVQPNVPGSEPMELKEKYGNSIAFFGGIDQQELLPSGNVDEIREEIKLRCEILGKNGGYMLAPAHIIQSDTTPETVKIMINAAKEFGKY
jgi:uroporphyrinogen decarboxylase